MDEKQNAVISRLKSLQEIIFELKYSNVRSSVESTLKIFDHDYPLSFNFIICHLIYIFSITQKKDPDVYFQYMKAFESKEREEKLIDCDLSKILYHITIIADLFESEFLLERMIEQGLITSHIVRDKKSLYFAHYKTKEVIKKMMDVPFIIQFIPKIESLSAYHWKLQRMLAHFGVNHKKIALILRNDDLDKLTKISEKSNFDINKTIPSLYERFSVARTDFFSLIDCAALYGSIKCFKFLLFNGADASHVTPYAVIGGNFEIIDLCCECNLSFDYTSYDAAIKFHQNEVFKYLYKNKIGKFKNLTSLGKKCVFTNNYELFFFLLNEGMELNDSIIHNAATIGNTPLISYILSKGIELPKNIFLSAVVSENLELAKYILQYVKVDMNARDKKGFTALVKASTLGNTRMVKLILTQKAVNINARCGGTTALLSASSLGHTEIVGLLLERDEIDVNQENDDKGSSLLYAAKNNYIEIVKLLLSHPEIDVNHKTKDGKTPLISACENSNVEIVNLLLNHPKIDINAKDNHGTTGLIYAAKNNSENIVKMLLAQNKIDINHANDKGITALMEACRFGSTRSAQLLLAHKDIDINYINKRGYTALIYASKYSQKEIVRLLLEDKKIKINVRNKKGETALTLACINRSKGIAKLLLLQDNIKINESDQRLVNSIFNYL